MNTAREWACFVFGFAACGVLCSLGVLLSEFIAQRRAARLLPAEPDHG